MSKVVLLAAAIAAMLVVPAIGETPVASSAVVAPQVVELTLKPPAHLVFSRDFLVGADSFPLVPDLNAPPPTDQSDEWRFLRYGVMGPQGLDAIGEMFDIDELERPWSTTTTVHFLAPLHDPLLPFLSVAHEVDALDEFDRYGLGGGLLWQLDKNVALTTEVVHFDDHSSYNETLSRETRMMARLEIDF